MNVLALFGQQQMIIIRCLSIACLNLTMLACQNGQTKTHVKKHGNTASSGPHSGPIDVPKIQPTGKLPGTLYSFLKIRDFPGMLS